MTKLRTILRYLGTCDGNMEKGSCAPTSTSRCASPGGEFGTRCEIKNVNSIRFIGQAIEYEARRQIDILEDGGKIDQETRLFDPGKGETRSMRSKEEAHDYRYFPDPDLLPLEFDQAYVDDAGRSICRNCPTTRRHALHARASACRPMTRRCSSLEKRDAPIISRQVGRSGKRDGKTAANWVINELLGRLNKAGKDIRRRPVSPAQIGAHHRSRSRKAPSPARSPRTCSRSSGPRAATRPRSSRTRGMKQVTDTGAIEKAVDEIIAANPDKVEQVKAKPTMLGWFVGQVMKATGGKANPAAVNEILKKKLGI